MAPLVNASRLVPFALAASLTLPGAACRSDPPAESDPGSTPASTQEPGPVIGIGGGAGGVYGRRLMQGEGAKGVSAEVRGALDRSLAWIVDQQQEDGSWAVGETDAELAGIHGVGVSGLALLALLGDGNTVTTGDHKEAVQRGVTWLLDQQDPVSGRIGKPEGHVFQYEHAIATLALGEAYHFSRSPLLKGKLEKAVAYVLSSRNPGAAWRYDVPPLGDNDTSVTGWMLLALDTAHLAGVLSEEELATPRDEALAWIDTVTDPQTGRVGYDSRGSNSSRIAGVNDTFPADRAEAMTGVGLYLALRFGHGENERHGQQSQLLLKKLPEWDPEGFGCDMYAWFFGTNAMRWKGGAAWERWYEAVEDALTEHQVKAKEGRGSYDPIGPWGQVGGRVYATALMALCLEAPFREAPGAR